MFRSHAVFVKGKEGTLHPHAVKQMTATASSYLTQERKVTFLTVMRTKHGPWVSHDLMCP